MYNNKICGKNYLINHKNSNCLFNKEPIETKSNVKYLYVIQMEVDINLVNNTINITLID